MDRLSKQRFVLVLLLAAAILQTDVEAQSSIKLHQFKAVDIGPSARVFESDSLPDDETQVATVGNGHVATLVYSDTVYMNGLYNGVRGESHRARIPSRVNIRMNALANETVTDQRFILDTEKGTFTERVVIDGAIVEQRTFAHRSAIYGPLLVTQITVDFSPSVIGWVTLELSDNSGPSSGDVTFNGPENYPLGAGIQQNGETLEAEDSRYQTGKSTVTVIYSEVPETVILTKVAPTVTYMMSISGSYEEASNAYLSALQMINSTSNGHEKLYQMHVDSWQNIWQTGNIFLDGPNLELAKVVHGSLFYLLSSLPDEPVNAQRRRFSGLSPGGLANGGYLKDYQGHSFWDTETWMYPPVLVLWPHIAKDLLLYRMTNIASARDRANETGYQGARFPWESGFTGVEVTPDCCPETRDNQQHITADIAFAARQYWAATGDTDWLFGEKYGFPLEINGCNFIRELAQFWASRATLNPATGEYEIKGVMPPDEDKASIDNSVYTNVMAAYSIFFAKHAECVCKSNMDGAISDAWLDIARKLRVPFNEEMYYHPEFDGYEPGTPIKQADVVLLGFPIGFIKDTKSRQNDLDIYENVTREDGPAMTWSMHSVGHLELGDQNRAAQLLNRSYQSYLVEPFKKWNEAQNKLGAFNFITGMGGFLQSIIFGYGGFRLTIEELKGNPILPPGITNFTIQGLDYLGCSLNFIIDSNTVRINWIPGASCDDLNIPSEVPRGPFTIRRKIPLDCPLPEDKPGQQGEPVSSTPGASSTISGGANGIFPSAVLSLAVLVTFYLLTNRR